jgi:transcriptional antiterminator RfaH
MRLSWHALYVLTNSERKISQALKERGFETCVPTRPVLRQWKDRKKIIEVVLFSNYVFVGTEPTRVHEILNIPNVIGFVKFGGRIACLTESEVKLIRQLSEYPIPTVIHTDGIRSGDMVEIIRGPFAQQRGHVRTVDNTTYIEINIPSLGCFANLQIPAGDIRKLDAL